MCDFETICQAVVVATGVEDTGPREWFQMHNRKGEALNDTVNWVLREYVE